MSSTREVEVSTDLYAAIWAARQPGEHTEDAILRRLLEVSVEVSEPSKEPTLPRPTPSDKRGDDELRGVFENLVKFPTAEFRSKPANIPANADARPGQSAGITSSQRRWEKLTDTLADPFRLVY
jgi:hypothetical protein